MILLIWFFFQFAIFCASVCEARLRLCVLNMQRNYCVVRMLSILQFQNVPEGTPIRLKNTFFPTGNTKKTRFFKKGLETPKN